jgi:type II secretion system protein G
MKNNYCSNKSKNKFSGFTLVELLVVIAILGILATIGLTAFTSAQARGRDTQRKSDLKQIASSLELYYSDSNKYPGSSNGQILGCPTTANVACVWGSGLASAVFTDTKTVYFKALPKDPSGGSYYYYRPVAVNNVANQGFQIFAHLENLQDPNIISTSYPCGTNILCNFSITSANTTPADTN